MGNCKSILVRRIITIFLIIFCKLLKAEVDSTKTIKDYLELNGYVKEMQTNSFLNLNNLTTDHLIHNRLNLRLYPSKTITIAAELRNRAFYGETIKLQQPFYGDFFDDDNGEVDMSWVLVNENDFILHTTMDRANVSFAKGNWNVVLGRQRINWGINLAWNPNDLFNAYNFADFDYIERPGTDALRVEYNTGDMANIEIAIKPSRNNKKWIGAGLYKFNKSNYDVQLLAGCYLDDMAIGGGWAGNFLEAGFKGEATYFQPQNRLLDTLGVFNASISIDYAFENSTYINASILYNSEGSDMLIPTATQVFSSTRTLSAKSLMPNKFSYFFQLTKTFTPAIGGGLSAMYLQGMNIVYVMPSIAYIINESWDIDLVGELFYGEEKKAFKNLGNTVFFRLQYSF